jgi:hypothetical protein
MKNINKVIIIIFLLLAGCTGGIDRHKQYDYQSTDWIVANDQDGVPTGIYYAILTRYNYGIFDEYGITLYNGYETPKEIYYKVYFTTREPAYYNQYIYSLKKLNFQGFSCYVPVKVEIIKLEDK